MAEDVKSVLARIQGRVQGVWYRGWVLQEAQSRGLSGWVRNRSDGSVEALVCGPKTAVNDLLDAFWQGPPAARVTHVDVKPSSPPDHKGFRHLATM